MKLIRENIDEAIKHLKPKDISNFFDAIENRLIEFEQMDASEITEVIQSDLELNGKLLWQAEIGYRIIDNIDRKERLEAIELVYRDLMKQTLNPQN